MYLTTLPTCSYSFSPVSILKHIVIDVIWGIFLYSPTREITVFHKAIQSQLKMLMHGFIHNVLLALFHRYFKHNITPDLTPLTFITTILSFPSPPAPLDNSFSVISPSQTPPPVLQISLFTSILPHKFSSPIGSSYSRQTFLPPAMPSKHAALPHPLSINVINLFTYFLLIMYCVC